MQQQFTFADPVSGRIGSCVSTSQDTLDQFEDEADMVPIEGWFPADEYWAPGGVPVHRPIIDAPRTMTIQADGHASVDLRLPAGTEVVWSGGVSILDDGHFVFTSAVPGTFIFEIEPPFPLRPASITIEAR